MPKRDYNEKSLDVLRKRFLKSFTNTLNDPRSPSLNLNRTPLVFDDALEKSLSLDDTFSNLFVESVDNTTLIKGEQQEDGSKKKNMKVEINCEVQTEGVITDFAEIEVEQQSPNVLQQEYDPRSPSIGVERTPIIFTDDEVNDTSEDVMLESILATLSLDMSSSANVSALSKKSQEENIYSNKINAPLNKHLDRVRNGKKLSLKSKQHRPKKRISLQRGIYEDQENYFSLTPTLKSRQSDKNCLKKKRTPLSCVRNRSDTTFVRSRSAESSAKSIKTRLALTSFDDSLNPTEQGMIHIVQQGSQD